MASSLKPHNNHFVLSQIDNPAPESSTGAAKVHVTFAPINEHERRKILTSKDSNNRLWLEKSTNHFPNANLNHQKINNKKKYKSLANNTKYLDKHPMLGSRKGGAALDTAYALGGTKGLIQETVSQTIKFLSRSKIGSRSPNRPIDRNQISSIEASPKNLFSSSEETTLPLGWVGIPIENSPSLEGLQNLNLEKFSGGEGHINIYVTQDGKELVGKIERSRAQGHLREEFEVYKKIGRHPNVVEVYGIAIVNYGKQREQALMMEYIQGAHGLEVMKQLHKMKGNSEISTNDYFQAMRLIARRLLEVTNFLKEKKIVHSDIKPENFAIDQKTGEIKVFDFGLSVEIGQPPKGTSDFYRAPEMLQIASEKGDVFTVGSTLLHGIEDLPRKTEGAKQGNTKSARKARDGLLNAQEENVKAFYQDEKGFAHHIPGIYAVETAYTQFLSTIMEENSNERPDSLAALMLPFLEDSFGNDDLEKARATLILATRTAQENTSTSKTPNIIQKKPTTPEQICGAIENIRQLRSEIGAGATGWATGRFLIALGEASELVHTGQSENRGDLEKLHQFLIRQYKNFPSMAFSKETSKKGKERVSNKLVLENKDLQPIANHANATLEESQAILNAPSVTDLIQLELLVERCKVLQSILPTTKSFPYFSNFRNQATENSSFLLAKQLNKNISSIVKKIEAEKIRLINAQIELAQQVTALLDATKADWYNRTADALADFDLLQPVVRGWRSQGRDSEAIHAFNVQAAAITANKIIEPYEAYLKEFVASGNELLQKLGHFLLSDPALMDTRSRLQQHMYVANRSLRLKKEWISEF